MSAVRAGKRCDRVSVPVCPWLPPVL